MSDDPKRIEPSLWPLAWVIASGDEVLPMRKLREPAECVPVVVNQTAGADVPKGGDDAP